MTHFRARFCWVLLAVFPDSVAVFNTVTAVGGAPQRQVLVAGHSVLVVAEAQREQLLWMLTVAGHSKGKSAQGNDNLSREGSITQRRFGLGIGLPTSQAVHKQRIKFQRSEPQERPSVS